MSFYILLIIAISLSMDAFSLSLAYGTIDINKKNRVLLSLIVGIYHFFMPIIGLKIGSNITIFLPLKTNLIVFLVLLFIGMQMIYESFKTDKNINILNIGEMLLFGLAVSLDSFSVGIGLNKIFNSYFVSAVTISISSLFFTYLGLYLGTKIHIWIGKLSTILGGLMLIAIGFIYLI
ncbi:MAG: manganese efflux pump [Bacilli bacterium]|nr:manganese efflux pump [Bacilli bacterium]